MEIQKGEYLGRFINNWRTRSVAIYADTVDAEYVITVGRPFDGSKEIICREKRVEYEEILKIIERVKPKIYIYE